MWPARLSRRPSNEPTPCLPGGEPVDCQPAKTTPMGGQELIRGIRARVRPAMTLTLFLALLGSSAAFAEPTKPAREEDGKYFDAEGNPTYNIKADGTVDWYTYSGYRRYHAECHTCHGPDGMGSTYA